MPLLLSAFLIGVTAGLRSLTAPAVVSWAAHLGWLHLDHTPLAFLASQVTAYILTALAIGELIADQLPKTPSRKAPIGFAARVITGGLCGMAIGLSGGSPAAGMVAAIVGAVVGTMGGYEARVRLARAAGRDFPIALLEDAIAIGAAFGIVSQFS